MANFMGPMAPPQAAPGQPPQLDIRTNPNQRQRFRNFMRQNTRPAGMAGVPPMYPAAQTPFPAAPMPPMAMPAPTPLMPMQMAQPMRPPMMQPMGPARNVDIFSPQYMQAQPPVGMEDGGSVPPRRTEIRGQDHMLSYITPKEAGILKALGGSGEAGPMGIPSYPDAEHGGQDSAGPADSGGSRSGPGDMGSSFDSGYTSDYGSMEAADARAAEQQAAIDAVNDMISDKASSNLAPTQKGPPMAEVDVLSEQEQETLANMEENEEEERDYKSMEPTFMDRIKSRMTPQNIGLGLLGLSFGMPLGLLGLTQGVPTGYVSGFDSVNANNPGPSPDGSGDIFGGGGDGPDPIIYPPVAPEVAPEPVVGNVMGGMDTPYVAPPSLPSPLVPSDRQVAPTDFIQPVGYGSVPTGTINPYAYLSAGFPVGAQFFEDGGEVLDQAASRFLEALTAA